VASKDGSPKESKDYGSDDSYAEKLHEGECQVV